MTLRIIYSFLLIVISLSAYCQSKPNCRAVLVKNLDTNINILMETVKICGGFSGDDTLLLQGPILAPQIITLLSYKNATYQGLIAKLDSIRHNKNYPQLLQSLKAERNSPPTPATSKTTTVGFARMINYRLALKEAIDSSKPLFLYFTSKYSMSSRLMEKGLLADDNVKAILDEYVRYVADVDDAKIRKFQKEKFNNEAQPYFVIIINDKKIAEFVGLTKDKNEFMDFLRKGLK